jgi:hypothetical protein
MLICAHWGQQLTHFVIFISLEIHRARQLELCFRTRFYAERDCDVVALKRSAVARREITLDSVFCLSACSRRVVSCMIILARTRLRSSQWAEPQLRRAESEPF